MPLQYDESQQKKFDELTQEFPVMGLLGGNIACAVDETALYNPAFAQAVLLEKLYRFGDYNADAADSLITTLIDLERLGGLSHEDAQKFITQITSLITR